MQHHIALKNDFKNANFTMLKCQCLSQWFQSKIFPLEFGPFQLISCWLFMLKICLCSHKITKLKKIFLFPPQPHCGSQEIILGIQPNCCLGRGSPLIKLYTSFSLTDSSVFSFLYPMLGQICKGLKYLWLLPPT